MIAVWILLGLLAVFVLYLIFLWICSLTVDPKKEYNENSPFFRSLLYFASGVVLFGARVKIRAQGIEQIPPGPVLFVGNHCSNFDPIIEWEILKKWNPAFISKPSNFRIPFYGRFIQRCCFMPIDRENPRNAITTLSRATALLKKGEVSVAVYPEGTRSKTGELLPFHNVVFRPALKAGVPIVVLAIDGTTAIHRNFPFHRSVVDVRVVRVMPPEETAGMRTEVIGEAVRESLLSAFSPEKSESNQ